MIEELMDIMRGALKEEPVTEHFKDGSKVVAGNHGAKVHRADGTITFVGYGSLGEPTTVGGMRQAMRQFVTLTRG